MELADMPVLETGSKECRFNSCHPHQIEQEVTQFMSDLLLD